MPNYLTGINDYSTKDIVDELTKRTGVERMTVSPHSEYRITIDKNWEGNKDSCEGEGSSIVLIIND